MSEAGSVRVEIQDGIGTVTFGHPKSNSLPGALLRDIAAQITALGTDDSARVIVLRSEGIRTFCAGASFAELTAIDNETKGRDFFMGFAILILAMKRCPKFIIARIQGKAVGGGVGVTAAADYALATDRAALKLSELALGLGPFVVGPVVEKAVGSGAFRAMSIDADWRDAQWGKTHGIYADVFPSIEELDTAVDKLATTLAASNPEAMTLLKQTCWRGTEEWDTLLPERAAVSGKLVLSQFTTNAIAAAKEASRQRRKPAN